MEMLFIHFAYDVKTRFAILTVNCTPGRSQTLVLQSCQKH